ncbi:FapA family protein [Lachnospiraceae bacterium 29-91]
MGFKKEMWSRFFGSKSEQVRDKQVPDHMLQEGKEKKEEQAVTAPPPPPAAEVELELPREHAMHKLCEMRVQRAKGLSSPRLRLEGREDFSQSELRKELGRLQRVLTLAANSRLKEVRVREEKAQADAQKALLIKQGAQPAAKEDTPAGQSTQSEAQKNESAEQSTQQEIPTPPPIEMDAQPVIHISADKLSAWLIVFPPIGEGKDLDREMLDMALAETGISFGVDEELLRRLPEDRNPYFSLFTLAKGKPAHNGKDGQIIEHFDRVVERKFEVDEHDRVDYASLHFFQSVEPGGVICEAVLPTPGEPGRTVLDQEIPAKDGKEAPLTKGQNTEISEDGTKLTATQAGHVEYEGKTFQVKAVLEIAENVDYSTGNINYMGDVHIHGRVCSGFSVRAAGNITVDGVVESAAVEAGGDLIVAKGIVGNTDSVVRADGSIFAKYLENSIVHARENLQADCIVNSEVYVDGEVQVRSGRGIIVGGRIRAAKKVSAKAVGSKSESQTRIYLGGEPCMEYEREELAEVIEEAETELEKLEKRPNSPDKLERMKRLQFDLSVNRIKLEQMDEELAKKQEEIENLGGCKLVADIAYPGLVLTICDIKARLKQTTSMCNARLSNGEIRFS